VKFAALYERIGHTFKDPALLKQAMTHRSASAKNYERLEFLGDAVLSCIIAQELYQRQPDAEEGTLSRMRAALVNGDMLGKFATALGLGEYLKLASSEVWTGGRSRKSILTDAFEALIGALYLDAGMDVCRECVLRWYSEEFNDLSTLVTLKDSKSALQEWTQAQRLPLPQYDSKMTGRAHAQTFHVTCRIPGIPDETTGVNSSLRKAEKEAAQKLLEIINARK
jgi:ribonuclease-3